MDESRRETRAGEAAREVEAEAGAAAEEPMLRKLDLRGWLGRSASYLRS